MGFQTQTSTVNATRSAADRTATQGALGNAQGLEGLGNLISGQAGSLAGQMGSLPNMMEIRDLIYGRGQARTLSNQLQGNAISMGRNELQDLIAQGDSGASVAGAMSGGAGGSGLTGRRLQGRNVAARNMSDLILQTSSQFNPNSVGSGLAGQLMDQRSRNYQALGNLAGIGGSLFGQAGGLNASIAGQEKQYSLGTADRTTTGFSANIGDLAGAFAGVGGGLSGIGNFLSRNNAMNSMDFGNMLNFGARFAGGQSSGQGLLSGLNLGRSGGNT